MLFDIGLIPSIVILAGLAAVVYVPSIRLAAAHLLPVLFSVSYLCGGITALVAGAPSALWVTLLIAGCLLPTLSWLSYFQRSRQAWAFLVAFCGVFVVPEFFGAMKLHNEYGLSRGVFLIGPSLKIIAVVALVELRSRYAERGTAAAAATV